MSRRIIYFLFFLNLGVIFFIWWQGSSAIFHANIQSLLLDIGKLCGLLAVNFILLQLLLIGRVKWIESLFGLDHLSRIHAINGKYIIFPLIILHSFFVTVAYSLINKTNVISQEIDFLLHWDDLLKAALGLLLFISVIILSITIVRRKLKYEFWYFTHLFVYLAILLAYGHQLKWGDDLQTKFAIGYWYFLYIFAFGNLIIFRFIKPWIIFYKHRFQVEKVVRETGDVSSIYITGKNMQSFRVSPGQFMIFRFLSKEFWWQTHPFSLSRPTNGEDIRISVKNSGDFTAELPLVKVGTYVYIDGPHGIFTEKFSIKNKILFIAGGIGVTPIRSLIEQLAQDGKDIVFLFSNKTKEEIVFVNEFEKLQKQYKFKMYNILTQEPNWKGESGRIDEEKIKKLVSDVKDREIYLCGPAPMMDSIVQILVHLGINKKYIHYEKFSL